MKGDRKHGPKTRLKAFVGRPGSLRGQLVRGGAGSLAVKGANMVLGLAVAVLLARTLGPAGYGVYTFVFALVSLMAVPAQLGLPILVLRETARAHVEKRWDVMKGMWRWASTVAGAFSLALAITGGTAGWFLSDQLTPEQLATFGWGLCLVPLIALGKLRGAALRGLSKVVQGQFPGQVLRPGALIALVALLSFGIPGWQVTPSLAMAAHAAAAALSFGVGAWLLLRARPYSAASEIRPAYRPKPWMSAMLPFALIGGMHVVNRQTDILMLGVFLEASDVGIYRVALQGAMLVATIFMSISTVLSPHIARLHATNDTSRLQRMVTASARSTLLITLPVGLAFIFFGDTLIRWAFGDTYVNAHAALAILTLGQLVSAAMGPVAYVLHMTGHERDAAWSIGAATITNVILNLALIPAYGLVGAAVATTISVVIQNMLLWLKVRAHVNIDASALGRRMS